MSERRPLRFIVVGVLNTALDFAVLFLLTAVGVAVAPANIISTSCALLFSFFANRRFTFSATSGSMRSQVVAFLAVTLTGLWVLQPLVIWGVMSAVSAWLADGLALLIGKGCATVVSMTWNYLLYSRFVFRDRTPAPHPRTLED